MNLSQLANDDIAGLRAWQKEHHDADEPHDAILTIDDSHVPVYMGDSHPEE